MALAAFLTAIAASTTPTPLQVGQTFLATVDDPAQGNNGWSLVSHGVGEKLYTLNYQEKLVAQLAKSVERISESRWSVLLEAGRHFSDGSPFTAADVAESLGRINRENSAARSSCGKMTFTATSELTLTIDTEINTPVMHSVLGEWPFVPYKMSGDKRVFTGPYAIESLEPRELHAVANKHYPDYTQCKRAPLVIKKYDSGSEVTAALAGNELHLGFNLPMESASQLNWVPDTTAKSFAVGYQYMAFFNTRSPKLSDVNVRKALALAIDRDALSKATHPAGLDATAVNRAIATGAFPVDTSWGAAHPQLPTNVAQAKEMLDAAGWTLNDAGVRVKGGEELSLDVVYYTFRSDLVKMAPIIKSQLDAVGAKVSIRIDDTGEYMDENGLKSDLLLWAQHTLPADDPNWFLETFFHSQPEPLLGAWTGQNFAMYNSATIDAALDNLRPAAVGVPRERAAYTAHNTIIDEAPATFLTTPTWHIGLRPRVDGYDPWGSDYYVVKVDMHDTGAAAYCVTDHHDDDEDDEDDDDSSDDKTGLYVAIGVVSFVAALATAIAAAVYLHMQKKAAAAQADKYKKPTDVVSP